MADTPTATAASTKFVKSNHSFSGVDIKAVFGGVPIGTIQALSYAITREKAPVYTMGDPDPRAFSRGKRAIAGSMVFIMFDRDPLLEYMKELKVSIDSDAVRFDASGNDFNIDTLEAATDESILRTFEPTPDGDDQKVVSPWYSDQIPPFDIFIYAANEYGAQSEMRIYNVEITDEGHGMSVDDVQLGKQMKWIARYVMPWTFQKTVVGSPISKATNSSSS